jgi:hypothetical protein
MIPVDDAETLSRLFHLNSEPWLNEEAYRGSPFHQEYKNHPDATARIFLPDPSFQPPLNSRVRGLVDASFRVIGLAIRRPRRSGDCENGN